MKCRVCRGPAVIDIRRHNANFCPEHFMKLCRDQTAKAIKQFSMFEPGDRLLVAVSGGKDSLAVWDLLTELGYTADGFYVGLGIGDYSETSEGFARRFAADRGLVLHTEDLLRDHGFDVPHGSRAAKRAPCSACPATAPPPRGPRSPRRPSPARCCSALSGGKGARREERATSSST